MNYIFLHEGYDPIPDPNFYCTRNIVNELKKDARNAVYVVCDGFAGYEEKYSKDEKIIHVTTRYEKSFLNENIIGKIRTILKRICVMPIWPIRFPSKVNEYVKVCNKLLEQLGESTTIISVYRPAETVQVGYALKKKHPNINYIIYNLDGIGDNFIKFPNPITRYKEKKWTESTYAVADLIIQMECHRREIESSWLKTYADKIAFSDFPLISDSLLPQKKTQSVEDKILIYAGSFYEKFRDPHYLVEWFQTLCHVCKEYKLRLYSEGNFQDYLTTEATKNPMLSRENYINTEELFDQYSKSSAVISMGNMDSPMVPSKIFTYINSLKPIVHFAYNENDSCIAYLKDYPRALILDMRKPIAENVHAFLRFINEQKEVSIDSDYIRIHYRENYSDYTVNFIREISEA